MQRIERGKQLFIAWENPIKPAVRPCLHASFCVAVNELASGLRDLVMIKAATDELDRIAKIWNVGDVFKTALNLGPFATLQRCRTRGVVQKGQMLQGQNEQRQATLAGPQLSELLQKEQVIANIGKLTPRCQILKSLAEFIDNQEHWPRGTQGLDRIEQLRTADIWCVQRARGICDRTREIPR